MGLFDGVAGSPGRSGTTADWRRVSPAGAAGARRGRAIAVGGRRAARLRAPDPAVRLAGVVLNRVGSERHRALVPTRSRPGAPMPVLGAVPRDERWCCRSAISAWCRRASMPISRRGSPGSPTWRNGTRLDAVTRRARAARDRAVEPPRQAPLPPPGQRIALARDRPSASSIRICSTAGGAPAPRSSTFSPLADEPPPEHCDACWLPGGYPELHAGALAAAARFRAGLVRFAQTRPVHGECGGYMVLGEGLSTPRHAPRHDGTARACDQLRAAQAASRLSARRGSSPQPARSAGARFAATSSTMRRWSRPATTRRSPTQDAQGRALGFGGRRGHVTGTFFHAIAQA